VAASAPSADRLNGANLSELTGLVTDAVHLDDVIASGATVQGLMAVLA
jgi:hypothetical protein